MVWKNISWLLMVAATAILACGPGESGNNTTRGNDTLDTVARKIPVAYDTLLDNKVALLAGARHDALDCVNGFDNGAAWKDYAANMDSLFAFADRERFRHMPSWAETRLTGRETDTTLFYPFSGPDFINAHCLYPNARNYIMLALEPAGGLPDICKMTAAEIASYLNTLKFSLQDIMKLSYFMTKNLNRDLKRSVIEGASTLIALFIKRTGHNIISIENIGVDTSGSLLTADKFAQANAAGLTRGVKIDFVNTGGDQVQTVYYFSTDISDGGLAKYPGFKKYLLKLPVSFAYMKAASYLLHMDNFTQMREIIFDKCATILQDDSGMPFRHFDKNKWDLRLYGNYTGPISLFSFRKEPDLLQAYVDSVDRPLPFNIGYKVNTTSVNMLYAVKKGVMKMPPDPVKK